MAPPPVLSTVFIAFVSFLLYRFITNRRDVAVRSKGFPLPPGPEGVPIFGNLFQIPDNHLPRYFKKLHEEHGPIVHINAAGTTMIVLGSLDVARQLLVDRASINSNRYVTPYMDKYINTMGSYWGFAQNDGWWALGRRKTNLAMNGVKAGKIVLLHEMEARATAVKILKRGGEDCGWMKEFERQAGSLLLSAMCGFRCVNGDEEELQKLIKITKGVEASVEPVSSIINFFPFLDLIPSTPIIDQFLPWRSFSKQFRHQEDTFYDELKREALYGSRKNVNTWMKIFAQGFDPEGMKENEARRDPTILARLLFPAGVETSFSTTQTFMLALVTHPEQFQDAINKLDKVVGDDRLPCFDDRPNLPEVDAVGRELLRWRGPAPGGVPHYSEDDQIVEVSDGKRYWIPKHSLIFPNQWSIDHDVQRYEDPETFKPSRHFAPDGTLKPDEGTTFGFGRRTCPGAAFGERSLWISVATVLWAFKVSKCNDPKSGKPFEYDDLAYSGKFGGYPLAFPCHIEPRSKHREEILLQTENQQETNLAVLLPVEDE